MRGPLVLGEGSGVEEAHCAMSLFRVCFRMINDDLFFEVKKRYDERGSNEL